MLHLTQVGVRVCHRQVGGGGGGASDPGGGAGVPQGRFQVHAGGMCTPGSSGQVHLASQADSHLWLMLHRAGAPCQPGGFAPLAPAPLALSPPPCCYHALVAKARVRASSLIAASPYPPNLTAPPAPSPHMHPPEPWTPPMPWTPLTSAPPPMPAPPRSLDWTQAGAHLRLQRRQPHHRLLQVVIPDLGHQVFAHGVRQALPGDRGTHAANGEISEDRAKDNWRQRETYTQHVVTHSPSDSTLPEDKGDIHIICSMYMHYKYMVNGRSVRG